MDLIAIALLCQAVGATGYGYDEIIKHESSCQKYYVSCWTHKREAQLKAGTPAIGNEWLAECVQERPIK